MFERFGVTCDVEGRRIGEHAPLVEHDDARGVGRFVDEVGGPENADCAGAAQRLHMLQKELAAFHIQADGRFIQQQ
jgi:hypothetical protein